MTVYEFLGLVVVAFASHRVQRVVTRDSISASFRAWCWQKGYEYGGYDTQTERREVVVRSWWWSKLFELVDCAHCTGWWCSLGVYWAWREWPTGWVRTAVIAVAVAGMQAFVSSRKDA